MRPAKREFRPGTLLAGKYKLQKQLGRGAAGVVWSAINVTTSRQVAIKLLLNPDPKGAERLRREALASGALKHPNVVDVYDFIMTEDGSPALVLELLEGQTLQQLILERAPLPQEEVAGIGRDVARALAIAHASGIVHRDLKPGNIFLHSPGEDPPIVKVVDFGISKNLLNTEGTLTQAGTAVGTPSFMSPEQVRGERKLDGRTDLWALGVILYEMLCGNRLFDGRPHEVLTRVLVQPIRPIDEIAAGIDPTLSRVVHGLLERDLEKRLASAEDVADWLSTMVPSPASIRPSPVSMRSMRPTAPPPARQTAPPPARPTAPPAPPAPPPPPPTPVASTPRGEVHDTTVNPVPLAKNPVPKIHEDDDEDDEATHVAPMAMRLQAAFVPKAPPIIYADDEDEEDGDRTRVAASGELNEVIDATREVKVRQPFEKDESNDTDQSGIATVRPPPGLELDEAEAEPVKASPTMRPPEGPASAKGEAVAKKASTTMRPAAAPASTKAGAASEKASGKAVPEKAAAEKAAAGKAAVVKAGSEQAISRPASAKQVSSEAASSEQASPEQAISEAASSQKVAKPSRGNIMLIALLLITLGLIVLLFVQRSG